MTTTDAAISTVRRGEIQSWTRTLIPTAKEAPADAEAPSHKLLARAGYIRRVGAGIYDYLPLAHRVLRKVSDIVREEMNAAGASEFLMPALTPLELFSATGRAEAYGDLLFRSTDRHGRENALGPTHEEVITDLMRGTVSSYKQLPLNLYQIQTKFRDEFRPRAGLLRCREFLMKDAYSFTMHIEGPGGLNEQYDAMYRAYENIFTRCGLDFSIVEAESGPIGGSASHEFMVNCEAGEDTILFCPSTGYAANVEKCEIGERPWSWEGEPERELAKHHTPGMPGVEGV
ncbi:MAG: proline--tRNA ligase, partial [Planctomycetota bacterium]